MLYEDETIKITPSCDEWMMTKSVAAIVGYDRCRTPRQRLKEALGYMRLPHIAKVDPVQQRGCIPGQ
ncbi:hypothetical protein TNCV_1119991 [Trichonephila clavipes]|uniref:Uncharacterized protein n=1 Tax=Trichonephila clavipes TaxID=2585209 RepID=A0A8X6VT16_TRICX|nr:hypothetical protein TNCV_1119991 [Trichonephila clavipes]